MGKFFGDTGVGNQCRDVDGELFVRVLFLRCCTHTRSCLHCFQADATAAGVVGRDIRAVRQGKYGCRSRVWKVSCLLLLYYSLVTIPRSRPVRARARARARVRVRTHTRALPTPSRQRSSSSSGRPSPLVCRP